MLDSNTMRSVEKKKGQTSSKAKRKQKGTTFFHKFKTNLRSDSLFPSDAYRAEPPGKIHISLTTLVSGGSCILRAS
jgi:hypothetical protein